MLAQVLIKLLIINQIIMYKISKIKPPYVEYHSVKEIDFKKIKKLYDSKGTKSSTLSKFCDDSETIIS